MSRNKKPQSRASQQTAETESAVSLRRCDGQTTIGFKFSDLQVPTREYDADFGWVRVRNASTHPLHRMNRAVAVAEWQGADTGLAVLEALAPAWLAGSYLWDAVLCDLQRRAGHLEIARRHRDRALTSAPSMPVRELLRRRLTIPA